MLPQTGGSSSDDVRAPFVQVGQTGSASKELSASTRFKLNLLKARIFALTFFGYAVLSGTRVAYSITKSALHPKDNKDGTPGAGGYAPFTGKWGSFQLGACDTVFLSAYALSMFFCGQLGDRLNLRKFLFVGMLGSGFFCFAFGAADLMGIHHIAYFLACNLLAGVFQASGPSAWRPAPRGGRCDNGEERWTCHTTGSSMFRVCLRH